MSLSEKPTVVLIGDSIRMGYQPFVTEALAGEAEIWAPEENGGDSRNVLTHLEAWVIARAPHAVHVNCGLHDVKKSFETGVAQVPLAEYEENVRRILTALSSLEGTQVVWASTTPVDEKLHHANKGFDRFEADVDAYNSCARSLCRSLDIEVHDLFAVVEGIGRREILREDGVHFTEVGSRLLGGSVASCVRRYLTK